MYACGAVKKFQNSLKVPSWLRNYRRVDEILGVYWFWARHRPSWDGGSGKIGSGFLIPRFHQVL